jgi:hypothetical protein
MSWSGRRSPAATPRSSRGANPVAAELVFDPNQRVLAVELGDGVPERFAESEARWSGAGSSGDDALLGPARIRLRHGNSAAPGTSSSSTSRPPARSTTPSGCGPWSIRSLSRRGWSYCAYPDGPARGGLIGGVQWPLGCPVRSTTIRNDAPHAAGQHTNVLGAGRSITLADHDGADLLRSRVSDRDARHDKCGCGESRGGLDAVGKPEEV